jgi:plastocyanin
MKLRTTYATIAAAALFAAINARADVIKIEGVFDNSDNAHKLKWVPNEAKVKVGDVVEWHAKVATHGVMFEDWDKVKAALKIEDGGLKIEKQPAFPLPAQGTEAKAGEKLLVKATVQENSAGLKEIPFFCTQHGRNMSGKLILPSAPSPAATTPAKK